MGAAVHGVTKSWSRLSTHAYRSQLYLSAWRFSLLHTLTPLYPCSDSRVSDSGVFQGDIIQGPTRDVDPYECYGVRNVLQQLEHTQSPEAQGEG